MHRFEKLAFCKDQLNRRADLRTNINLIEEAKQNEDALFALFCDENPLFEKAIDELIGVRLYKYCEIAHLIPDDAFWVFAGIDLHGKSIFLINVLEPNADAIAKALGSEFSNLRAALWNLNVDHLEIFGLGNALFHWHKNHQYCAKCGGKTADVDYGFKRLCTICSTEHFPRVDPVVIMLVLFGEKCLLARSKGFPASLYSVIAGFLEPAETIEQACRRETIEETGLVVKSVEYIANQPWPFASQLMLGLKAFVENDNLKINYDELEDALWLDKEEVRQLLSSDGLNIHGQKAHGPRKSAIAHALLSHWIMEA